MNLYRQKAQKNWADALETLILATDVGKADFWFIVDTESRVTRMWVYWDQFHTNDTRESAVIWLDVTPCIAESVVATDHLNFGLGKGLPDLQILN